MKYIAPLISFAFSLAGAYLAIRVQIRKNRDSLFEGKISEEKKFLAAEKRISLLEQNAEFREKSIDERLERIESFLAGINNHLIRGGYGY